MFFYRSKETTVFAMAVFLQGLGLRGLFWASRSMIRVLGVELGLLGSRVDGSVYC